ncbi:hypothetical protein [Tenacibaculum ovolyticum]|uniref:hypothetical protein n=1 Tax=Tenacibaculum ovolyticum TaxID=104270 RepID=UPI0007EE0B00|nr:hypothetical protein [Tenacibaculum ovolyticum]
MCIQERRKLCKTQDITTTLEKKSLTKEVTKNWEYKDITNDTLPSISLEKAYAIVLKDKKGKKVIVAVLDSQIDLSKFNNSI